MTYSAIVPHSFHRPKLRALVVGGGVSGLTTALLLQRGGFKVTVVAENLAPNVTSVIAGALWEWPPAVCGSHQNPVSLQRSKSWCVTSYAIFSDLANDPDAGVFMRLSNFYFKRPIEPNSREAQKMDETRRHVRQFLHDPGLIQANQINPATGVQDAYRYMAPMIDTDVYMAWLLKEAKRAGCEIRVGKITGALRERELELKQEYNADVIVNCAGLGAQELAGDPMWPLRGALVVLRNDADAMPRVTEAHCLSHDGVSVEPYFVFILPRGQNLLLVGGMAEPNEWNLGINLENYPPFRVMFERSCDFLPALRKMKIAGEGRERVGLRPVRKENVRLETEPGTSIIHNYGHGGSGVTFSWGCAQEVVQMAEGLLSGSEGNLQAEEGNSVSPSVVAQDFVRVS